LRTALEEAPTDPIDFKFKNVDEYEYVHVEIENPEMKDMPSNYC
jgi:hypothetical protein